MRFPERYDRNRNSLSEQQQKRLADAKVLVLGCGGVGGYVIEYLARIGVGHIAAADGDVFQAPNLNRQLLSTERNIGRQKVVAAQERVAAVNSTVEFAPLPVMATEENIDELLRGRDVVIDCLDNADSKLLCARAARRAGVPFIHGAISGWCIRVHAVLPGDESMEWLCTPGSGMEARSGSLPFAAAACACMEAAEAVKLLLGIGEHTGSRIIEADLLTMRFDEVELEV